MLRRDFLKGMISAPLAMSSWATAVQAATTNDKGLVLVFMRGGWDGLNIVVPHADDTYYTLRPNIAIRPPTSGHTASALDLDGFFGLHPSLSALHRMYGEGRVALMPAVHYAGASRSHFHGQDVIEAGSTTSQESGWLARYLIQEGGNPLPRVLSLTDQVPLSLLGLPTPASAFSDLGSLDLASSASDRAMLADVLTRGYGWDAPVDNPYSPSLYGMGKRLLDELGSLHGMSQQPEKNGAAYPLSAFGRQLKQAAGLIRNRIGLNVITLNLGGWDTHSSQGGGEPDGRMAKGLTDFSESVSAFFTDLGSDASRVMLLTSSEFGRTAAENGSKGTDHGSATVWMAIGPGVRGGIHLGGAWPGLTSTQLLDGRSLAHTMDFRSIYSHVLSRHLGATGATNIFPGYSGTPVDILA